MKKSKFAFAITMVFALCLCFTFCTKDQDVNPKLEKQEVPYDTAYGVTEEIQPKKKRKKR